MQRNVYFIQNNDKILEKKSLAFEQFNILSTWVSKIVSFLTTDWKQQTL